MIATAAYRFDTHNSIMKASAFTHRSRSGVALRQTGMCYFSVPLVKAACLDIDGVP